MTYDPVNSEAPFVEENPFFPPDFEQLLLKLTDYSRSVSTSINQREICAYERDEILSGSTLFSVEQTEDIGTEYVPTSRYLRPVYRKVIDFGPLPNSGVTSIPHYLPISETWQFIKVLTVPNNQNATGSTPFATPIPNATARVDITLTDVVITTTADYSAYNVCTVILEYVKF
jgi:hypothetical protein